MFLLPTIYTTTSGVGSCELKEEIDEYCSAYICRWNNRKKRNLGSSKDEDGHKYD